MELVPPAPPSEEQKTRDELWSKFQLKCYEVGVVDYHIKTVTSQLAELEKKLDITKRDRNKAGVEHDEYLKANAPKLNITKPTPKEEPKIELNEASQ